VPRLVLEGPAEGEIVTLLPERLRDVTPAARKPGCGRGVQENCPSLGGCRQRGARGTMPTTAPASEDGTPTAFTGEKDQECRREGKARTMAPLATRSPLPARDGGRGWSATGFLATVPG